MHEAVRCATVINAPGLRLEAAEQVSEGHIVATTSDGTLLSLKAPEPSHSVGPWQVVQAVKSFSRKPVTYLRYLQSHGYVLTQADDGVGLFELATLGGGGNTPLQPSQPPSLRLVGKTKNPTCFCVNRQETLLCVCTKKKLLIFQFFEGEFNELNEFPLSEAVKRVEWCGEYLIVAQKREYQLFNLKTGTYSEVIPTGKSTPSPKILQLPYNELLLLKDNVGVFVGLDGKLTRKFGVSWSDAPQHMQVIDPHAIAVFGNLIEVRSLHRESSHAVVQTIPLKGITFCSSNVPGGRGSLLLGSQSSIHMLTAVPLLEQITQLGKSGEFEEALRLCDSITDEDHVWRLTKSSLHQRYGWALFARKMWGEAVRQFSLSSKSPRHVLRLFPSVLPEAARAAVASLPKLPVLKDCRFPERSEASDAPAFRALLPYLEEQRRRIKEICKDGGGRDRMEHNRRNSFGALENGDGLIEDAMEEGWGGVDLIQLVDTAILHCYLVLESWDALLAFLRADHHVDSAEAEQVLQMKGHYIELVLLFRGLGRHHEALGMLKSLVIRPDTFQVPPHETTINGIKGTNASIEYLLGLGEDQDGLVLEHSKWIAKFDPEGAFRVLTNRYPGLSPETALAHLQENAPALRNRYLEFLLTREADDRLAHWRDKLAVLLLDEVVAGGESRRVRLREILSEPLGLSPEWILSQLPDGGLLEERALVLRKMGRHAEALEIYVGDLGSEEMALAYCEDVYTAAAAAAAEAESGVEGGDSGVYLDLVRTLLRGCEGGGERLRRVLDLLVARCDRIDIAQVLGILPEGAGLGEVLPFLEASFSHNLQSRKKLSILKSLTKQEALQVRGELVSHQKQSVVVTPESVCKVCYKRIQNSVFVLDKEDGRLTHFVCHRRRNQQQQGGVAAAGRMG